MDALVPAGRTLHAGASIGKADVSTLAKRRKACNMLLDKGLIRIGRPMPPNAEIALIAVDDPDKLAGAKELYGDARSRIAAKMAAHARPELHERSDDRRARA